MAVICMKGSGPCSPWDIERDARLVLIHAPGHHDLLPPALRQEEIPAVLNVVIGAQCQGRLSLGIVGIPVDPLVGDLVFFQNRQRNGRGSSVTPSLLMSMG